MEKWALGYLLGHFLALQSPILPSSKLLILAFAITAVFLYLVWKISKPKLNTFFVFLFGSLTAVFVVFYSSISFFTANFIDQQNQLYQVEGVVSSRVFNHDDVSDTQESNPSSAVYDKPIRFDLSISKISVVTDSTTKQVVDSSNFQGVDGKISLKWFRPNITIQQGDSIRFMAKLNKAFGYRNAFGFDYQRYAFARQIFAKGYIKGDVEVLHTSASNKQNVFNLLVGVTGELDSQNYILALVLGEKRGISSQQRTELNHAGIGHLFAISGLHIAVVFLVLKYILGLLFSCWAHHYKYQWLTLMSLLPIWWYVFLLDGVISANRAALFVTLWAVINVLFCHITRLKKLLYIAVFSLLLEPFAMLQVAWWLSFGAVLGILIFIEWQTHSNSSSQAYNKEQVTNYLWTGACWLWQKFKLLVQFQTFIFVWMLPFSIYWFAGFSLSGLLVNLFVIPLFCLILIPYLFVASFMVLLLAPVLGEGGESLSFLFVPADWLIINVLGLIQDSMITQIWLEFANGLWPLFALLIILFWCGFHQGLKRVNVSLLIMLFTLPLTTFVWIYISSNWPDITDQKLTMRVIDVGQGTSVIFQRNNRALVYDLGPSYPSGFSATKAIVAPNLNGQGIVSIDHLIISHQDADHKGDYVAISHMLNKDRQHYLTDCPQQAFYWQSTLVEPLWPNYIDGEKPFESSLSDNDRSCVLKLTDLVSGVSVLLTGDISKDIEYRILMAQIENQDHTNVFDGIRSDIMFSAHHGSKHSTSYSILKAVQPSLLIHTAGLFNQFNFPSEVVQQKARTLAIKQISTSDMGETVVNFSHNKGVFSVESTVDKWSPYWKKQNPFSFDLEIR